MLAAIRINDAWVDVFYKTHARRVPEFLRSDDRCLLHVRVNFLGSLRLRKPRQHFAGNRRRMQRSIVFRRDFDTRDVRQIPVHVISSHGKQLVSRRAIFHERIHGFNQFWIAHLAIPLHTTLAAERDLKRSGCSPWRFSCACTVQASCASWRLRVEAAAIKRIIRDERRRRGEPVSERKTRGPPGQLMFAFR